jgi:hypothetical protein
MPFTSYSELQDAIATWMIREDFTTATKKDVITLAEARLNRELETVETNVTLTGTANSRTIDVSAYNIIEPMALYFTDDDGDEKRVALKPPGEFAYIDDIGRPTFATLVGDSMTFDRPLDSAYSMRFHYRGRFALSDSATTNALLDDHPDVYLAACLMWGGIRIRDKDVAASMNALLDKYITETKSHQAQRKRGVLRVDPAILVRREDYWWQKTS